MLSVSSSPVPHPPQHRPIQRRGPPPLFGPVDPHPEGQRQERGGGGRQIQEVWAKDGRVHMVGRHLLVYLFKREDGLEDGLQSLGV